MKTYTGYKDASEKCSLPLTEPVRAGFELVLYNTKLSLCLWVYNKIKCIVYCKSNAWKVNKNIKSCLQNDIKGLINNFNPTIMAINLEKYEFNFKNKSLESGSLLSPCPYLTFQSLSIPKYHSHWLKCFVFFGQDSNFIDLFRS